MTQTLNIQLFGSFSFCHKDHALTEQLTGRQQELLAYLVLNRDVPQSRQRLAFQFWPNSSDERARANLRKELSRLRKAFPDVDEWLQVTPKTLLWRSAPGINLDIVTFEDILNHASTCDELKTALGLYRGEFLPEIDSEWILPERDRLHQRYMRAIEMLVHQLEKQKEYASALTYAQELRRLDELNESTYATLIRLFRLLGDRANALQTYHQCMTVLREELGIDPSAATQQLYEQLLQDDEVPSVTQAPPRKLKLSPLIGRVHEWQAIEQWVAPLKNGAGCADVLLLLGEPGIGKTRLLEELEIQAQDHQIQVLWGSGYTAEMMRPYGFWIDTLRSGDLESLPQLPTALKALLPELGPPAQALSDPSHLYDAVVEVLTRWTQQAPLLVLLDDIQGLDEASAALLNYVIRVMHHAPIGFACGARVQELDQNTAASQVVKVLRRDRRIRSLSLPPLDRQETLAMTHSVDANLKAGQIYTDSGGNPLFVLEIARAIADENRAYSDNLEALIQDRLRQLDEANQTLIKWSSAMGRNFNPVQVAQIADVSLTHFLAAVEKLEEQGILVPDLMANGHVGYMFAHDVIRQVAYHQLSEPRRRLMHRHIALQLQGMAPDDDIQAIDIAYHAKAGQEAELAATAFLAAAERGLQLFAYADAASLAHQGIEQCQALASQVSVQIRLLKVLVLAGLNPEQAPSIAVDLNRLIADAQSQGLKEDEAIGRRALIALHYEQDNLTKVYENCLLAVEQQDQHTSPAISAKMLAYTGWCLADIGREMERAEALLLEAQTLTDRLGIETFEVSCGLGCVWRYRGNYNEARPLLRQAVNIAFTMKDHWRTFICLSYLVMLELEANNPKAAWACTQELKAVADQLEEGSEQTTALAYELLSKLCLPSPQSEEAIASTLESLRKIDAQRTLAYVLTSIAQADLAKGQTETAMAHCQAAITAAQMVDQANDVAMARAILIRCYLNRKETKLAKTEFQTLLKQKTVSCSARTQEMIDTVATELGVFIP